MPANWSQGIAPERWPYRALALIAIAIFVANVMVTGQAKRGRWDLNQHIATADRVAAGGNYYTNGMDSLFASSTAYFPGVTFIAQATNAVAAEQADTILLALAAVIFLSYLGALGLVGRRLGVDVVTGVLAGAFIARLFLSDWLDYAIEFKPDTIALLAGTVVLLLITTEGASIPKLAAIFAMTVLGTASKQQFLLFYAGLMAMVIWSPYPSDKRNKVVVGATLLAAGFAALMLLTIDNLYEFAVQANQRRPLQPFRASVQQLQFIFDCWPFVIAAFAYLIVHAPDAIRRRQLLPKERGFAFWYGVVAVLWLVMSVRSAVNVGGNIGNVAVGVSPFVPLAIVLILSVTKSAYHRGLFIGVAVMLTLISARDLWKSVAAYREYAVQEERVVSYLKERFAGKSILNDGDGYMFVRKAGLLHKTEFDTAAHLLLAGRDTPGLRAALEAEAFDVVLSYGAPIDYWVEKYPNVFGELSRHYVPVDDPANPLPGRILVPAGLAQTTRTQGARF